jgi:hypothetical protein
MRHHDPHDDPPAKQRPTPYRGPPVTLGHLRCMGISMRHLPTRPCTLHQCSARPILTGHRASWGTGPHEPRCWVTRFLAIWRGDRTDAR